MAFMVTVFAHLLNKILFKNVYVTEVVEDGPTGRVRPLRSLSPKKFLHLQALHYSPRGRLNAILSSTRSAVGQRD